MQIDWASILGAAGGGGLLGILGNAASLGIGMLKGHLEHKRTVELIKLQADAKTAEAASAIAIAHEQGAAAAFTASIQAEGNITGESRWVKNWRGSTRPGLTSFGLLASVIFGLFGIENGLTLAINAYTGMMIAWWFGQRANDKLSLSFGSKLSTGTVSATASK
jgi:hypothetical protein